ncbi:MAG: hypothetical protein QW210_01495 [Candidatus Woesearchaeota archaeon]
MAYYNLETRLGDYFEAGRYSKNYSNYYHNEFYKPFYKIYEGVKSIASKVYNSVKNFFYKTYSSIKNYFSGKKNKNYYTETLNEVERNIKYMKQLRNRKDYGPAEEYLYRKLYQESYKKVVDVINKINAMRKESNRRFYEAYKRYSKKK